MLSNPEIENALELLGKLMELHGENIFKAKSYINASFQISKVGKELSEMSDDEITQIPGIGHAILEKIHVLLKTGSLPLLETMLEQTPPGLLQLLQIKGLGPKKLAVIWKELGVESIGELEYACRENHLLLLKGFGAKTQKIILDKIEFIKRSAGKLHYAAIEPEALKLENELRKMFKGKQVSISGAFRRCDLVIEQLDIVVAENLPDVFKEVRIKYEVEKSDDTHLKIKGFEIPIVITCCEANTFYHTLFQTTGTVKYLEHFTKTEIESNDEEGIFNSAGIPYIIPEMRNGKEEFSWVRKYSTKDIVNVKDIKGIIHAHTTWSDGLNSMEEMAVQCMSLGMEYLAVSDHSVSAFYAQGLSVERIIQQHHEIDALNKKLAPFKIFKSIECDILSDGSLDYKDEVLERFDCVIASIHSVLNMDIDRATQRLLRAIRNPYTTFLGHLTGRLLLSRTGYPVHYEKIIDACAEHQVIIELNANPWRLDIDWQWIYYAMEKGVSISINPDAHNKEGVHDIHYGTLAARKGGLTKEYLFNYKSLGEAEHYFKQKKQSIRDKV